MLCDSTTPHARRTAPIFFQKLAYLIYVEIEAVHQVPRDLHVGVPSLKACDNFRREPNFEPLTSRVVDEPLQKAPHVATLLHVLEHLLNLLLFVGVLASQCQLSLLRLDLSGYELPLLTRIDG